MNYPKQVMSTSELLKMGFPKNWLVGISNRHGQKVAWKSSPAKNAKFLWDVEELEKIRQAECTRGYQW